MQISVLSLYTASGAGFRRCMTDQLFPLSDGDRIRAMTVQLLACDSTAAAERHIKMHLNTSK